MNNNPSISLNLFNPLTLSPEKNNMERNPYKGEVSMTIIIGALFDGGTGAIFCSDKTTTLNLPAMVLENTPKIIEVTSHSVVLASGIVSNYLFLDEAKNTSIQLIKIGSIADNFANAYRIFRLKKIQQEILPQYGFWSLEDYFSKQKNLNDFLIGTISEQIKTYNLYVELIVGGVDESGHIFQIVHPGTYIFHDTIGFCCLGTGGNRASSVFDYFQYSKDLTEDQVLEIIYCGKKKSEKMGGIGEKTDIKIITKDGIRDITAEQIKMVEKKYSDEKLKNPTFWE